MVEAMRPTMPAIAAFLTVPRGTGRAIMASETTCMSPAACSREMRDCSRSREKRSKVFLWMSRSLITRSLRSVRESTSAV